MNRNHFFHTVNGTTKYHFFPEYFARQDKLHHNAFSNQFSGTLFTRQACKMRLAGHGAGKGRGEAYYRVFGGET